jgi:HEAT repeat protein
MLRTSICVICTCLTAGGCNSGRPAPAPAAGTSTSATDNRSGSSPASTPPAGDKTGQTSSAVPFPATRSTGSEAAAALRELAARLVESDGLGGWRINEKAATELEKLGPDAIAGLWPLLAEQAVEVRRGAAFYLLKSFDPANSQHAAAFATLLEDDDRTVRGLGLAAASQMHPADQLSALPRLASMLDPGHEDKAENRAAIARLLGQLKSDAAGALPMLVSTAASDPEPKVRSASLVAIAQVAAPQEAVPALAKSLSDQDAAVRLVAAARLRQLGADASAAASELAAALADDDARVREAAAEALIRIGGEAVEPLAAQLASQNVEARKLALASLAKIGPDAKPALAAIEKCKQDEDPLVRQLAEAAFRRIVGE